MRKHYAAKIALSLLMAAVFVLSGQSFSLAQNEGEAVVINIHGEINGALISYLEREVKKAEKAGAEVIIIDIDTWGGFVFAAEQINDILSSANIPTIAYISKKAVSAGVMITISCDMVVMTPGSHSGAGRDNTQR